LDLDLRNLLLRLRREYCTALCCTRRICAQRGSYQRRHGRQKRGLRLHFESSASRRRTVCAKYNTKASIARGDPLSLSLRRTVGSETRRSPELAALARRDASRRSLDRYRVALRLGRRHWPLPLQW